MNQSQALLLFGVTDLALGLAFLYLWRYILPRRYAILLAVARGWAVLEAVTLLLQIRYPAAVGLGAAARLFSAVQTVCYIAGLYDLVRRRAPWVPLAALGVLLAAWGIGGSRWSSDFLWLTLPNSLVLTIAYVGIAWVLFHGPTTPGRRPLAVMLVIAGLHNLDYPWLATLPWGYSFGLVVALFNALAISALLLIVLVEEARREATVADAARQESEGRYRAIFDFAPVGVAVVDPEGRYVQTNPAFERLLGFSKSELQGHHFREFTATEDLDPTVHVFERMVAGGRDYFQIEKRYRRKDGATVWGHLSVAAVRDARGALLHTVSLIEDVSDAKRHEAEARHAAEGA